MDHAGKLVIWPAADRAVRRAPSKAGKCLAGTRFFPVFSSDALLDVFCYAAENVIKLANSREAAEGDCYSAPALALANQLLWEELARKSVGTLQQ